MRVTAVKGYVIVCFGGLFLAKETSFGRTTHTEGAVKPLPPVDGMVPLVRAKAKIVSHEA